MLEEVVKWDPIVSGTNTGALSEKAVAGLAMNSESMLKASHEGGDCFHSSGWDPIVSLSQTENYGTASMVAHGMFAGPSYPIASYPNAVEMVPRLGGGNFSEMVSPFDVPGYGRNFAGICPERYASNKNVAIGKACTGLIPPQEYCQIPNERTLVASPNGKRKLLPDPSSLSDPSKTAEADLDRDLSGETSEPRDSEEKKQRIDQQNSGPDQFTKQTGNKQVRDTSQCGEAPKDNYIHVRARRGQATNSHSLAERFRREKISQRMRLLQELVPGCNKIIGKAVMLDEIINYVQSLQQQVEFLSMKLATVNPELNFDIDGILSKEILHLRGRGAPILGFNPGSSSSPNPYAPTIHQEALTGVSPPHLPAILCLRVCGRARCKDCFTWVITQTQQLLTSDQVAIKQTNISF